MRYETFRREQPVEPADLSGRHERPFVRTPFNYDRDAASRLTAVVCELDTRTQQQFKEECDINTIAKNFGITGRLPEGVRMPTYGDFEDVTDFQSALNAARRASQSFMEMPAAVRERFANSPQKFLEFCSDANNREEAISLGLVPAPRVSAQVPPPPDKPAPL